MADLVHIEQIADTISNVASNADEYQVGIYSENITQGYPSFWWEDGSNNVYSAACIGQDASFVELTVTDDVLIDEYIKLSSATDNYIRMQDNDVDIVANGSQVIQFDDSGAVLSIIGAAGAGYTDDKILVGDSGRIKYLTSAQLAADLTFSGTENYVQKLDDLGNMVNSSIIDNGVTVALNGTNFGLNTNYISYDGSDEGLNLDASNNATFSETLTVGDLTSGSNSNSVIIDGGSGVLRSRTINSGVWDTGDSWVKVSGTPLDNQIAVWTSSDTIEGDIGFIWNGTKLKINNNVLLGTDWESSREILSILSSDAQLALVSSEAGIWGSGISFKQSDSTSGTFDNAWGIVRQTNENGTGNGSLRFTYGSGTNIYTNAPLVAIDTSGDVSVAGTLTVESALFANTAIYGGDTTGTELYLRNNSIDDNINIQLTTTSILLNGGDVYIQDNLIFGGNIALNGSWLGHDSTSNEGISVADNGLVTISSWSSTNDEPISNLTLNSYVTSTGVGSGGFGASINFDVETQYSSGDVEKAGRIYSYLLSNTHESYIYIDRTSNGTDYISAAKFGDNVELYLGGSAGSENFYIKDSSGTICFSVNSDGRVDLVSDLYINSNTITGDGTGGLSIDGNGNVNIDGNTDLAGNIAVGDLTSGSNSNDVIIDGGSGVLRSRTINSGVWDTGDSWVKVSGTPLDNQIAIFTDNDTVEGDSNLTWNTPDFLVGNTTASSTSTPVNISLGGTYSNSQGSPSSMKLALFEGASKTYGFGVWSGGLDIFTSSGVTSVFKNTNKRFEFNASGTASSIILDAESSGSTFLSMRSNANTNNGDYWRIENEVTTQYLNFQNNTSGSLANVFTIDTSGNTIIEGDYYLGDSSTDGSWRIARSGNNLVIQRRESGSWVTKDTISA